MSTVIDSYPVTGVNLGSIYDVYEMGVSFSPSTDATLVSFKPYIKKVGTPTGSIYAKVYNHAGIFGSTSEPTGSPIATSDAINVSLIDTGLTFFDEFSFSDNVELKEGVPYVITLAYSGGDTSNCIQWGNGSLSNKDYHGNSSYYSAVLSAWNYDSNNAFSFYLYGDQVVGANKTIAGISEITGISQITL